MLFNVQRDTLLKPLQTVTGIVEKRHTLPILANVLIEGSGNRLSFIATDLEIQIHTTVELEQSINDFQLTVAARKLLDICRALPDVPLSLESSDSRLALKSGKSKFALQTLPAADFPKLAQSSESKCSFSLPQAILKERISLVQFAMAQQDIRYYLNGLLLSLEGNMLNLVATDGHRLSLASTMLAQSYDKTEVILPRKTVQELAKLLGDQGDVNIDIGANQVRFEFGNIVLSSKIVDGKFPDYNRVIPARQDKFFNISRTSLQQALQRAAILSNEKFKGVRLVLTTNTLGIICNNNEQEEAHEELEIAYSGGPLDIGFNVSYLLDVMANLGVDEVACSFGDASSSAMIMVPGQDDFKYVVMPMRI